MNRDDLVLDDCGCCENSFGEKIDDVLQKNRTLVPLTVYNRPGLSEIKYRIGTHSRFKTSLIEDIANNKPLNRLKTRLNDDFVISLFDAWATVADVLTFYQERIANEAYLRTAKERFSILQLARSIGYELRPGVAATTKVAFTLEDAPGAVEKAVIDIGTKVQSLPAQGEMSQVFETVERIEARPEFNELRPKLTRPQTIDEKSTFFYFKGINNQLKKGDGLLVIKGSEFATFNIISEVKLNPLAEKTFVTVFPVSNLQVSPSDFNGKDVVYVFRIKAGIFGHNAPRYAPLNKIGIAEGLRDWDIEQVIINENSKKITGTSPSGDIQLYDSEGKLVYLDNSFPNILSDSWIVIMTSKGSSYASRCYQVRSIREETITEFALTARVTGLTLILSDVAELSVFKLRKTSVFAQNEEIELAEEPNERYIEKNSICLDRVVSGLQIGQQISVSGQTVDQSDVETGLSESEIAVISKIENFTKLTFENNLKKRYEADTVTMNANISNATHGETKLEVLGSGDPSQKNQEFLLKEKPLTYLSATAIESVRSTLEIRVNDILWKEVPSLYRLKPNDRAYTVRIENDGNARVIFGDGNRGARLSSDIENVTAKYRVGIGRSGLLKNNQLSLLMSRPLGVRSVTNPNETNGADDPDNVDDAREHAPLTVNTIDRIVSLKDFENFAKAFSGIGKAQAIWIWDGERKRIHITVASSTGQTVTQDSPLFHSLCNTINNFKDPMIKFSIESFSKLTFGLDAKINVSKERDKDKVFLEIKNTLNETFSFEPRRFGQHVSVSEIMSTIQQVKGVLAVDVDCLYLCSPPKKECGLLIPAKMAEWDDDHKKTIPAELLIVDPQEVNLEAMTA